MTVVIGLVVFAATSPTRTINNEPTLPHALVTGYIHGQVQDNL